MLHSDLSLTTCLRILEDVNSGDLSFDRTLKVNAMVDNCKDNIMEQFPRSSKKPEDAPPKKPGRLFALKAETGFRKEKLRLLRLIRNRRRKGIDLLEEINIRTKRIQPMMKRLQEIVVEMEALEAQIQDSKMRSKTNGRNKELETPI